MSETSYTDGFIYKYETEDGSHENLINGISSTYDFGGATKTSSKISSDLSVKVKTYVWTEDALDKDYESENVEKVVGGYIDNESESYFVIHSAVGVQELADHYSLPMPVINDDYSDFVANFDSWGMAAKVKGYVNPVVASVKFDANDSATMLKLYRGNYTPTEDEINLSKAHWLSE